tara:strand:- start:124 stop:513 length:390 start_codon:yes stop_codon:yes gene_type:complete
MNIHYRKKQRKVYLISGIGWLVIGIIQVTFDEKLKGFNFGWFILSGVYLIMYFYQKRGEYLTLENGIINVNGPFGKKLILTEVKRIKKFAGDYILKTDEKELTINTQIIDPNSLAELNAELKKLNVEWN